MVRMEDAAMPRGCPKRVRGMRMGRDEERSAGAEGDSVQAEDGEGLENATGLSAEL